MFGGLECHGSCLIRSFFLPGNVLKEPSWKGLLPAALIAFQPSALETFRMLGFETILNRFGLQRDRNDWLSHEQYLAKNLSLSLYI